MKITNNGEEVKINDRRSENTDNEGSRRRKKHNHATVVASKKRIINMNGEVRDSDRSDVTSLEGKINLHINVLARFCIHGADRIHAGPNANTRIPTRTAINVTAILIMKEKIIHLE